jgi:hypothetical protein
MLEQPNNWASNRAPFSTQKMKDPAQKLGMITLESGLYSGNFKISNETPMPYGLGIFQSSDESIIKEGQWFNGQLDGIAKEENLLHRSLFTGEFVQGEKEGVGCLVHNGHTTVGKFKEGALDGPGIVNNKHTGVHIKATWCNGQIHGYGEILKQNFSVKGWFAWGQIVKGFQTLYDTSFEGEFKQGKPHGCGILKEFIPDFNGYSSHFGYFQDGLCCAYGEQKTIADQCLYEGNFLDDMREGVGKLTDRKTGAIYIGEFRRGLKHGFGSFKNSTYSYISGAQIKEKEWEYPLLRMANSILVSGLTVYGKV